MDIDEIYEAAANQYTLYTICQHDCDGMKNCKMFATDNDIGCLKSYYHYLNLIKNYQSEILTNSQNSYIIILQNEKQL